MNSSYNPGEWSSNVRFVQKGCLHAHASGVLLVPPADAVALVTDAAGDALFRVVERTELPPGPSGGTRVSVVNKAAIRVLAWKLWTKNHVVYDISPSQEAEPDHGGNGSSSSSDAGERVTFRLESSNMLHSLVGSWHMQPLKIHYTALPQHLFKGADSSNTGSKLFKAKTRSATTASAGSRSSGGGVEWPRGLRLDADGSIAATLVRYEQTAKPKGMPPGLRFVPGLADVVRGSVQREVKQMLDKIGRVASLAVHQGITPQAALLHVAHEAEEAGGSFKKLQQGNRAAAPSAIAAADGGASIAAWTQKLQLHDGSSDSASSVGSPRIGSGVTSHPVLWLRQ